VSWLNDNALDSTGLPDGFLKGWLFAFIKRPFSCVLLGVCISRFTRCQETGTVSLCCQNLTMGMQANWVIKVFNSLQHTTAVLFYIDVYGFLVLLYRQI
jgi:hypothetical protein